MNIGELPEELLSKIQGYAHDYPIAQLVNKAFFESTKKYPLKYESLSDYTLNFKFNETIGHLMFHMNRMAIKGHFDIIPLMIEVIPRDLPYFYDTGSITLGREGIAKAILAAYALLVFNLFGKFERGIDIYDIYHMDIEYILGLNIAKYIKPMKIYHIRYILDKYEGILFPTSIGIRDAIGYINIDKEIAKHDITMKEYKIPANGHLTWLYYTIDETKKLLSSKKLSQSEIGGLLITLSYIAEEPVLTLKILALASQIITKLKSINSRVISHVSLDTNPLYIYIFRDKFRVIDISPDKLHLHSKIIQDVYKSVTAK